MREPDALERILDLAGLKLTSSYQGRLFICVASWAGLGRRGSDSPAALKELCTGIFAGDLTMLKVGDFSGAGESCLFFFFSFGTWPNQKAI